MQHPAIHRNSKAIRTVKKVLLLAGCLAFLAVHPDISLTLHAEQQRAPLQPKTSAALESLVDVQAASLPALYTDTVADTTLTVYVRQDLTLRKIKLRDDASSPKLAYDAGDRIRL